jgi:hypothetical protein
MFGKGNPPRSDHEIFSKQPRSEVDTKTKGRIKMEELKIKQLELSDGELKTLRWLIVEKMKYLKEKADQCDTEEMAAYFQYCVGESGDLEGIKYKIDFKLWGRRQ